MARTDAPISCNSPLTCVRLCSHERPPERRAAKAAVLLLRAAHLPPPTAIHSTRPLPRVCRQVRRLRRALPRRRRPQEQRAHQVPVGGAQPRTHEAGCWQCHVSVGLGALGALCARGGRCRTCRARRRASSGSSFFLWVLPSRFRFGALLCGPVCSICRVSMQPPAFTDPRLPRTPCHPPAHAASACST